jgi:manganese transport protein
VKRPSLDQNTVAQAVHVLGGKSARPWWSRLWPFIGPAFIASVAYIDPGNFAVNIEGGAKFGYTLLWVVVVSNLFAILIQALSAKLGIATGKNLAEMCRDVFPKPLVWLMWITMELVAMATDLAEFLGAALGFYLLFGWPLALSALATAVITFGLLIFERYGFRPLEWIISAFVAVVAVCYVLELWVAPVHWSEAFQSLLHPHLVSGPLRIPGLIVVAGILGATVMPHVIFLHSALTQGRIQVNETALKKRILRYEWLDIVLALGIAGFINAAMLLLSASTFHDTGLVQDGKIEEAYRSLRDVLGPMARYAFGISLLAAGLSSSAVGTMSGQIMMQGFLKFHIPIWLRRVLTMAPALIVIWIGMDPTHTLVLSQMVLSFGLPFALVPLLYFTMQKRFLGELANRWWTSMLFAAITLVVVTLNFFLLYQLW